MGLALERPFDVGTAVEVSFHLVSEGAVDESKPRFCINANVVWSTESDARLFDIGVRFENLSDEDQSQLDAFITSLT